ncbi:hypothetical protein DLH72_03700 [Candidatus Gracilibacteria bacterium]|nr:MAG: hypothetical protein DLH72_03700 [Candidatus Gracilibacteria bacterium]
MKENNITEKINLDKLGQIENEVQKNRTIYSKKIEELTSINSSNLVAENIERLVRMMLLKYVGNSKFSFLRNYQNGNNKYNKEKFIKKFKKYFPIHEEIFFKVLNEEISKAEYKNNDNDIIYIKNTVTNLINKYFLVLFIFSEKIKIKDLENFLKMDINNLSVIFSVAERDLRDLERFDEELSEKITKNVKQEEAEKIILKIKEFLEEKGEKLYGQLNNEEIYELSENFSGESVSDLYEVMIEFSERKNNNELKDLLVRNKYDVLEKIKGNVINDDSKKLLEERFFSSMYRQVYRETELELELEGEGKKNKGEEIAKKIEKIYEISLDEIRYILEVWFESGYRDDERLLNIKIIIHKFFEGIIFMKNNNIAFADFPIKRISDQNFLKAVISEFVKPNKTYVNTAFSRLIRIIFSKDEIERKKLNNNLREAMEIFQKTLEKSRVPEHLEKKDNLDVDTIDFEKWQEVLEEQKYELVFSKVVSEDGKIKFADFLEFKSEKLEQYFNLYTEFYSEDKKINLDTFKISLRKQLNEIINSEGKTVEEFIKTDVNNLNFLILWWRFILKIRTLNKKGEEINLDNLKKLSEKSYGIIEKISRRLTKEGIIKQNNKDEENVVNKIVFNPDGRIKNTSIKSINTLILDLIKGLKKGFIDLSNKKVKLTNGEIKVIGKIQDIYIPQGLTEQEHGLEKDIQLIQNHLDNGIDLCYSLLKGKKINGIYEEAYYKNVFAKNNILPENQEDLTYEDLEKIQSIVETLKFIKDRCKHLKEMLLIARKDREILEKDEKIKKLLRGTDSGFGPEKAFNRAFIKLISSYGGNFNNLGDLTRMRIICSDINSTVDKIIEFIKSAEQNENITHISVVDKIGEPISMPKEKSGYRDVKLLLKLKSGNTTEVQFQIKEMFDVKDEGLDLENEENKNIFEKMGKEGMLFNRNEIEELLKISKERNIELPTKAIILSLMEKQNEEIDWESYEELLKVKNVSSDYTYHIIRQLDKSSSINRKLTRLERILADSAWSKIVIKYLLSRNVKIN